VRHDSIGTQSRAGAERTEEGEIGSDGDPGSGEERRGHGHWRGPEAKREGVARGALRRENGGGGEQGRRCRATPFLNGAAGSRGRGSGVGGIARRVEGGAPAGGAWATPRQRKVGVADGCPPRYNGGRCSRESYADAWAL
jgi:hypothetical protein